MDALVLANPKRRSDFSRDKVCITADLIAVKTAPTKLKPLLQKNNHAVQAGLAQRLRSTAAPICSMMGLRALCFIFMLARLTIKRVLM